MPGKLDEISRAIGAIETSVKAQDDRSKEDREERLREHRENQNRMGEIAQSTAASIAELSRTASQRWEETCRELASLRTAVTGQGHKLDEHAAAVSAIQPQVAALQLSRGRLVMLAAVGLIAISAILKAGAIGLSAVFTWGLSKIH
jgi:hypothetical protein